MLTASTRLTQDRGLRSRPKKFHPAARVAAGAFGFLIFSHAFDGPDLYGASRRFETAPPNNPNRNNGNVVGLVSHACSTTNPEHPDELTLAWLQSHGLQGRALRVCFWLIVTAAMFALAKPRVSACPLGCSSTSRSVSISMLGGYTPRQRQSEQGLLRRTGGGGCRPRTDRWVKPSRGTGWPPIP